MNSVAAEGAVQERQVFCIGTLDTKEPDVRFLAEALSSSLSQFLPSSQAVSLPTDLF